MNTNSERLRHIAAKYIVGSYSINDVTSIIGEEAYSARFEEALVEMKEHYEGFLSLQTYYTKCSQYTTIDDIPEEAWKEANHQYTDVELQKVYNEWEKKRLKCIGRIAEQAFKLELVTFELIYKFFEDYHLTPNEVRIFWREYYSLLYSTDL